MQPEEGAIATLEVSDYATYCPICAACVGEDPQSCPECHSPRPSAGWQAIATSPYPYLGKIVDDRYVVDRFLGAGTTGAVYRAVGRRIRRPFALKIVDTRRHGRPDFEAEMARRFELEVEAMSQLRNPHIVNVYESLRLSNNVYVLAMDYVEGVTLEEMLERLGGLEVPQATEIVRQIANGLHEAHARGIIHRDLKPENVMVEQLPAAGVFARVLDFGIAFMVDSVRQTAGFRGTPLYASPEQCQSGGDISARSDIYSLGCVLFHCLTGRPPFEGKKALAVMDAHVNQPAPRLADAAPDRRFPPAAEALVASMLSKQADARPSDLAEVIRQLDRLAEPASLRLGDSETMGEVGEMGEMEVASPPTSDPATSTAEDLEDSSGATEDGGLPRPYVQRQRVVQLVAQITLPDRLADRLSTVTASVLGPGGDFALLAEPSGQLHLVGLKHEVESRSFDAAGSGTVTAVAVDVRRGRIYAAGLDGNVVHWNLNVPGSRPEKALATEERFFALDVDLSGNRIACGTERGELWVVDLRTGRRRTHRVNGGTISTARFLPDGRVLVGCWSGHVAIADLSQGAEQTLERVDAAAMSSAVDGAGRVGAILAQSGKLRLLDMEDPEHFFEIEAGFAAMRSLELTERGQLLGMSVADGSMKLWVVRNESALQHLSHATQSSSG